MELALGLIETKGLIGAIEAADAMAKAADVKIINKEKSTAALVTIKIVGEVAAVQSAVDAGSVAAQRVGQLISAHVIPRPHKDIESLIRGNEKVIVPDVQKKSKPAKKIDKIVPDENKKEKMKVSPVTASPIAKKIKEKPVVKETPEPIVEPDKKEEIKKEIPAIEKEDTDELKGLDHLKKLREEAQSEMNFSDKSEQEPVSDGASEDIPAVPDSDGASEGIPAVEEMEKMNVHQLRKLARSIPAFPIKGRDISKANRGILLDYLKDL